MSQPLDIVYNPIVIKVVSEFFEIPEDLNPSAHLSENIQKCCSDQNSGSQAENKGRIYMKHQSDS